MPSLNSEGDTNVAGTAPRIGRSVSLDHAATLLGVSRRTIYNRIREGRLQTIRTLGGSQRVRPRLGAPREPGVRNPSGPASLTRTTWNGSLPW